MKIDYSFLTVNLDDPRLMQEDRKETRAGVVDVQDMSYLSEVDQLTVSLLSRGLLNFTDLSPSMQMRLKRKSDFDHVESPLVDTIDFF